MPTQSNHQAAVRLFKAITKTEGATRTANEFVDWYECDTENTAREQWTENCFRYGLQMDKTTVEIVECDPETLKPLT